jgi:flagellar hook-length control protein FliK
MQNLSLLTNNPIVAKSGKPAQASAPTEVDANASISNFSDLLASLGQLSTDVNTNTPTVEWVDNRVPDVSADTDLAMNTADLVTLNEKKPSQEDDVSAQEMMASILQAHQLPWGQLKNIEVNNSKLDASKLNISTSLNNSLSANLNVTLKEFNGKEPLANANGVEDNSKKEGVKFLPLSELKSDKTLDNNNPSVAALKTEADVKGKVLETIGKDTKGNELDITSGSKFANTLENAKALTEHHQSANNTNNISNIQTQLSAATAIAKELAQDNTIKTPFSNPNWNQAIQQKVVYMVGASEQSATLTLNPPDLGPLKVVVQVDNQSVNTTFITDNPEVKQALQDGMDNLRLKMQESGIQLGQANVNTNAQSQAFQQALSQESSAKSAHKTLSGEEGEINLETTKVERVIVKRGVVDTFA